MKIALAVGCGGALGSGLRYALALYFIQDYVMLPWPWGTFIANVAGSLLLGMWAGWLSRKALPAWVVAGVGTGFCGGFTTMSTFMLDAAALKGAPSLLALYVLGSLGLGLIAAALGWYVCVRGLSVRAKGVETS